MLINWQTTPLPSWTIYLCTEIPVVYRAFVIPSNHSAALWARRDAVTSHGADILSLSFI